MTRLTDIAPRLALARDQRVAELQAREARAAATAEAARKMVAAFAAYGVAWGRLGEAWGKTLGSMVRLSDVLRDPS